MAIRIRLTKAWKIAVIATLVLILGGSGGYLLWRTNQPDTVAPTDSDASGGAGACCGPAGCVAGWKCQAKSCSETISDKAICTSAQASAKDFPTCPSYKGASGQPTDECSETGQKISCTYNIAGTCVRDDNPEDPEEGTCKVTCEWPETLMSDTCTCEKCNGSNGCSGNPPTSCTPPSCAAGSDAGTSVDWNGVLPGGYTQGGYCTVYHPDCNNPTRIYRYCNTNTSSNTCDSGEWLTKPTGTYKYCDPITYSAKAKDKDGIDKATIIAKLNSNTRSAISLTNETTTTVDISETLSTAENCLAEGTYSIDLTWKDKKGATSTACTLTTSFSVLSVSTNPDWTISKKAVEQCTEENESLVAYTIKIKNTGDGAGSIDKIIDTLDSKVLASYLSGTISEGGLFGSNQIVWELEGASESFTAGQEKTYTYSILIPSTAFGTYTNTVMAYPTTGENFSDSEEVLVDCIVDVPQTGLFDSTISRIVAGVVLLLIGFNLNRITMSFNNIQNSFKKLSLTMEDNQSERRKKNFEKKIVKR